MNKRAFSGGCEARAMALIAANPRLSLLCSKEAVVIAIGAKDGFTCDHIGRIDVGRDLLRWRARGTHESREFLHVLAERGLGILFIFRRWLRPRVELRDRRAI